MGRFTLRDEGKILGKAQKLYSLYLYTVCGFTLFDQLNNISSYLSFFCKGKTIAIGKVLKLVPEKD